MKINFEKIFFYFMIMVVSGSIGYAIKPEPQPIKEQVSYEQQNEACIRAMSMMKEISKQTYYNNKKTSKQIAIERMMRD